VVKVETMQVQPDATLETDLFGVAAALSASLLHSGVAREVSLLVQPGLVTHKGKLGYGWMIPWQTWQCANLQILLDNLSTKGQQVQWFRGIVFPVKQPCILQGHFNGVCKERPPPLFRSHGDAIFVDVLVCPVYTSHSGIVLPVDVGLINENMLALLARPPSCLPQWEG